ncbi:hypothetical protein [Croceicoccus naphthovorans]|uniref:Uncharacterized protein n=1 Tax=Croceicoccus naphthovorans TaxID=1348774 RepID=A0A0G3XE91_9SPHN|nr:hypothetical protein [Croceicoccus naphthovorans]AKM08919.1 hypothetical protein AB433_01325 [Croceicoccus naphthovorans]MBB3989300.1 ABC-type glycerol-3-phosphate transport system substrate-binding protein [Croceicoccus naphthovorans]
MKKIILPALAAVSALGLAACGSETTPAAEDAAMADDTAAVDTTADTAMTAPVEEGDGDSLTVSEDGLDAQINDGDTSVTADIDEDPSMTVTD